MKELFVLSAAKFEANPALEALKGKGFDCRYLEVGIGPLLAAKNARALAEQVKGKPVVFLGTCGVFFGFSELELVTPRSVSWLPSGGRIGASEAIENLYPSHRIEQSSEFGLRPVDVVCGSEISFDPSLPPRFAKGDTVENLELYSILPEVTRSAKSFTCVLAITNEICQDSRVQWKANFKSASQATAKHLVNKADILSKS